MDGEGAAHALLRHRSIQDSVVGRVVNGIGEAREHHQRNQRAIHGKHTDQGDCDGLQRHAGDENAARAVSVHQESDRRLSESRGQTECGERESELGEADAIDIPQYRKQRRQQQ